MNLAVKESVNVAGLTQLYKSDAVFRSLCDHFAQRERNQTRTTVDRILANLRSEGTGCSRGDIIAKFKELEQFGCGEFVVGRHNHPSRFEWQTSMSAVGKAAAGEQSVEFDEPLEDIDESEAESEENSLQHSFCLREDWTVTVNLPRDITVREAERFAEFIKAVPF